MTNRVLFVCMGNICRSPLAEGLLKLRADAAGFDVAVDSAGTGSWHVGDPPDARAIVAARQNGFDISSQRARILRADDFSKFDLIVAMDDAVMTSILKVGTPVTKNQLRLMSEFVPNATTDIPDPYYSGKFEPVIALLESGMSALIAQLQADARQ